MREHRAAHACPSFLKVPVVGVLLELHLVGKPRATESAFEHYVRVPLLVLHERLAVGEPFMRLVALLRAALVWRRALRLLESLGRLGLLVGAQSVSGRATGPTHVPPRAVQLYKRARTRCARTFSTSCGATDVISTMLRPQRCTRWCGRTGLWMSGSARARFLVSAPPRPAQRRDGRGGREARKEAGHVSVFTAR